MASMAKNILYLDDDASVAISMTRLLQSLGHKVTQARTIVAAEAEVKAETFDLLIVDAQIHAGTDGLDWARAQKQFGGHKVFVVTGNHELTDEEILIAYKPVSLDALKSFIAVTMSS